MEPMTSEEVKNKLKTMDTISKGEEVVRHLTDEEMANYFEYSEKIDLLKSEKQVIQQKIDAEKTRFFDKLKKEMDTSKSMAVGVKSNGETIVLVQQVMPENLPDFIKQLKVNVVGM